MWQSQLTRLELENQGPCLNSTLNSDLDQAPSTSEPQHIFSPTTQNTL